MFSGDGCDDADVEVCDERPAPVARLTLDAAGVHWTPALAPHYIVKFRGALIKRW